jgi:hypothetical protein
MGVTSLESDGTVPTICSKKKPDVDPYIAQVLFERMDLLFHPRFTLQAADDLITTDLADTWK